MTALMWATVAWVGLSCFFLWLFSNIESSYERRKAIRRARREWSGR